MLPNLLDIQGQCYLQTKLAHRQQRPLVGTADRPESNLIVKMDNEFVMTVYLCMISIASAKKHTV